MMVFENNEVLEFGQYQLFDQTRLIIYADLEYLIEKIN